MNIKPEKIHRAKLIGGTRDGETWDVYSYQPILYLAKRITIDEAKALEIDSGILWKSSEEVYVRQPDGTLHYRCTVHYKPGDAEANAENGNEQLRDNK